MRPIQLIVVLTFVLIAICSARAQQAAPPEAPELPAPSSLAPSLRFSHLTVDDGLSQATVHDILQDKQGFMWLATQRGLNRYDGRRITVYKSIPFDTTSLEGDWVVTLLEGRDGRIWVGTMDGLFAFDPTTEHFVRFGHDPENPTSLGHDRIGALYQDSIGALWIGTRDGLNRMDPGTGEFARIEHDPADSRSLSSNMIHAIDGDPSGALWVSTNNGLNRLDADGTVMGRYFYDASAANRGLLTLGNPADPSVRSSVITDVYAEDSDALWVATENGLVRFHPDTERHVRFLPDPGDSNSNLLRRILPEPRDTHRLWITSDGGGLYLFDKRTEQFAAYRNDPQDPSSIGDDELFPIYADRSGVIWVGSYVSGLSRFVPARNAFRHYRAVPGDRGSLSHNAVWGIYEDRTGVLWIGTQAGLDRLDRKTGTVTHWPLDSEDPEGLHGSACCSVLGDGIGMFWVGTYNGGLHRMDRRTGQFTHFRHDPNDSTSISGDFVAVIRESRTGELWIGTGTGLNLFEPKTGRFKRYSAPEGAAQLESNFVQDIHEDDRGNVWIATNGGVHHVDRTTGAFLSYRHDPRDPRSLSSNAAFAFVERPEEPGVLWIGTSGGLNRLDMPSGDITHFTEEHGLPDNSIVGLLADEEGYVWLSTYDGIVRFDPETRRFLHYGVDRGVQAKEFNAFAFFKSPRTGELFFGGINGFNAFFPDELEANPTPPPVALTELRLMNEEVRPGEHSLLRKPLSMTPEVRLPYWQKMITLEFAALHFVNPALNQYAYQLEGFDADWVPAGTNNTATYTNLDPGSYTFRVKAASADGVWNEEGASVALVILPPWWRTTWAYVFYVLLFVAGVVAVDRIQRRRLIRREREKARERELAQAKEIERAYHELEQTHADLKATQAQLIQQEKMASLGHLTAGIAHEIKNPLNFVNNFSSVSAELVEEVRREASARPEITVAEVYDVLDDLSLNLEKIEEHGRRADGIVRSMLLHSRGTSGDRREVILNELLDEYVNLAYHGMRAQHADFACEIERDFDEEVGAVEVLPQEIGRVFINLLNNAFDAVRERVGITDGASPKRPVPNNDAADAASNETAVGEQPQERNRSSEGVEQALTGMDEYHPRVTVSTRRRGDRVEIVIEDNGPGIPPQVRERIFEPFFTTKPTGSGTGLGLSLSYDIVTQGHGGELEVMSERGQGAGFVVRLPSTNIAESR